MWLLKEVWVPLETRKPWEEVTCKPVAGKEEEEIFHDSYGKGTRKALSFLCGLVTRPTPAGCQRTPEFLCLLFV